MSSMVILYGVPRVPYGIDGGNVDAIFTYDDPAIIPLLVERMMCHGDAMDCLSDGRHHAALYLKEAAELHPGSADLLNAAAAEFTNIVKVTWHEMIPVLGGWERGEAQLRSLAASENRRFFGALIDRMRDHDARAPDIFKELSHRLS